MAEHQSFCKVEFNRKVFILASLARANRYHKYLKMFVIHFKNTLVQCGKSLSVFTQLSSDINSRNLGFLYLKIYFININYNALIRYTNKRKGI